MNMNIERLEKTKTWHTSLLKTDVTCNWRLNDLLPKEDHLLTVLVWVRGSWKKEDHLLPVLVRIME